MHPTLGASYQGCSECMEVPNFRPISRAQQLQAQLPPSAALRPISPPGALVAEQLQLLAEVVVVAMSSSPPPRPPLTVSRSESSRLGSPAGLAARTTAFSSSLRLLK